MSLEMADSFLEEIDPEHPFPGLTRFLLDADAEALLAAAPALCRMIPELRATVNFDQHSPHHAYDVYTHICYVTAAVPREESLRWAALLHDVGKPACFAQDETGRGHFKGHAQVGAEMAAEILRRLDAPRWLAEDAVWMIAHHMEPLPQDGAALSAACARDGFARTKQLLCLQEADSRSKGKGEYQNAALFAFLREKLGSM